MPKAKIVKIKLALSLCLIIVVAVILAIAMVAKNNQTIVCNENYRNDALLRIDLHEFNAHIVSRSDERTQGLSGKECILENQTMLFVFEKPDTYGFWMKDMKFAIDIVWLDENKTVVHIEKNVQPSTYPKIFSPEQKALYVCEFSAGTADKLNIGSGTRLDF